MLQDWGRGCFRRSLNENMDSKTGFMDGPQKNTESIHLLCRIICGCAYTHIGGGGYTTFIRFSKEFKPPEELETLIQETLISRYILIVV